MSLDSIVDYVLAKEHNPSPSSKSAHHVYKKQGDLRLLRYTRTDSSFEPDDLLRACRGIIVDASQKKVVCRAPKGKLEWNTFKTRYPCKEVDWTYIEDGTMVNAYYYQDAWHLSTKSCIQAAHARWRSSKHFHDLFWEVSGLRTQALDKAYTYTFVLVHRESKNILDPFVYEKGHTLGWVTLVQVTQKDGTIVERKDYQQIDFGSGVRMPRACCAHLGDYSSLEKYVTRQGLPEANGQVTIAGVMGISRDGERGVFKTRYFESLGHLRGNTPCIWENTVRLLHENRLHEYMEIYPEDAGESAECCELLSLFIDSSHEHYLSCFVGDPLEENKEVNTAHIKKQREILQQPRNKSQWGFLQRLHTIYKDRRFNQKLKQPGITHKVVKATFHGLDHGLQAHLLKHFKKSLDMETVIQSNQLSSPESSLQGTSEEDVTQE